MNKNRFAKASREQLEALAEAVVGQGPTLTKRGLDACVALALACPTLRTRAEVDAEIVRVLRENVRSKPDWDDCLCDDDGDTLRALCKEETQDP